MGEPKVAIVLLNYCRWRDTLDCVRSFDAVEYTNYEIVIVDNASTDSSEQHLREALPGINIVQSGKNLGYTGGVNFGIREALKSNPDFILLLNEDTLVTPPFLNRLVDAMVRNPTAAAAGGTIYHHPETSTVWYAGGRFIPWRGLAVHDTELKDDPPGHSGVAKVSFVTGCLVLLRTTMLPAIGLKDERFFMSLEDIEHSARILNRGFDILYVRDAVIYHRIPVIYESKFNLYYSVRNRLLLINLVLSPAIRWVARCYFLVVIFFKLAVWRWTNPVYYKVARAGLEDYFAGKFFEGRGVSDFAKA
jgi:GT2 family glycosyltransferase